jgi:hypothetical protein
LVNQLGSLVVVGGDDVDGGNSILVVVFKVKELKSSGNEAILVVLEMGVGRCAAILKPLAKPKVCFLL